MQKFITYDYCYCYFYYYYYYYYCSSTFGFSLTGLLFLKLL